VPAPPAAEPRNLNDHFAEKLIRRLKCIHVLDEEDEFAIRALPIRIERLPARDDIVIEGDRPSQCCIMFEGISCMYKTTRAGKRQILAFYIAGDLPDLHSLHLPVLDSTLRTISPCTVGFVPHSVLRQLATRRPQIASAFWRSTLIDGSIFREWVTNVGARQAYGRISHLLCEQVERLRAVGLVGDDFSCKLPLTQGDLAEATGLSAVHVNRSLQDLRKAGLISFDKMILRILDWPGLKAAGEFDPTYLFLEPLKQSI
jgi:CRP-like cAMP-binding protein